MKLLLDTHAFLWMILGDQRMPESLRSTLRSEDNSVWLSTISIWEIVLKQTRGRLVLPGPGAGYAAGHRRRHYIASLPLEEATAGHLAKLPPLHRDPFDRMLICQAIEHEMTMVTADEQIRRYPIKTLWA
ncbi:MAG: twitching motility protein PilT [Acidobacteria bacterium RIFCSPLOWO2_12_FULL_67_14b]|nr:MAG: twitching motility protein PilT [Acidobacteria bacterium RIFCSPLOWO2_12_FULL_67_14b]